MTVRVVEAVVRSPVGVYGLFALPFVTLAMEKSIYDTVQAWQGLDPNVRPADRGGFPSGGAGKTHLTTLPSRRYHEDDVSTERTRISTLFCREHRASFVQFDRSAKT